MCRDSDLSKPFGKRRNLPDAEGFQQQSVSVLQKGRIDGGVLAPGWEKGIAGCEMAV